MSKHAKQFGCGSLLSQVLPHKYSLTPGWVGVIWIHEQIFPEIKHLTSTVWFTNHWEPT